MAERRAKGKRDPVVETVQVIDKREVAALGTRTAALDMPFKLKGSYAPKQIDFEPGASVNVLIDMSSILKKKPLDGH